MLKEAKGLYFGASVTGLEGGTTQSTTIVCDDLGNQHHYSLFAVNETKASLGPRLDIADFGIAGVQLLIETNNNPYLGPGEQTEVILGNHKLLIEGTREVGVLFNGQAANKLTPSIELERFPWLIR